MCSVVDIRFICKYEIGLNEGKVCSGLQRIKGIQSEYFLQGSGLNLVKQSAIANSL